MNLGNWLWNHITSIWEKAPAVVRTLRLVAEDTGIAGAHKLYWIACSPDSPGAEWQLTDATAPGGAIVYDHFDPDKHSEQLIFAPPMQFNTGIWIEKFDHMHSLVFGYI
ncbi:hypothetical protein ES703_15110 [subsurface metagenome]